MYSPGAAEALLIADWPRNVRELQALLQSAAQVATGDRVRPEDLVDWLPAAERVLQRKEQGAAENAAPDRREALERALERHGGNVAAVARELRKPRSYVYRWLETFGLSRGRFRRP